MENVKNYQMIQNQIQLPFHQAISTMSAQYPNGMQQPSAAAAESNQSSTESTARKITSSSKNIEDLTCPLCHKTFSRADHRRRHELLHSGERPFKCDLCDFNTNRRDKLTIHNRKRHNISTPMNASTSRPVSEKSSKKKRAHSNDQSPTMIQPTSLATTGLLNIPPLNIAPQQPIVQSGSQQSHSSHQFQAPFISAGPSVPMLEHLAMLTNNGLLPPTSFAPIHQQQQMHRAYQ